MRQAQPDRQRLRSGHADEQRTHQPGTARHRDRVDVAEPHACLGTGALDRRHHRLEVRAAGDLGHDPAEARMLLDAGGDGVGQQRATAHHADTGLVAGRLDAEHQRRVGHPPTRAAIAAANRAAESAPSEPSRVRNIDGSASSSSSRVGAPSAPGTRSTRA